MTKRWVMALPDQPGPRRRLARRVGGILSVAAICCMAALPAMGAERIGRDPADRARATVSVTAAEWQRFAGHFVLPSGRVVDREGGAISHSEGQGYGMLLAVAAGERADFDRIWRFTHDNLRVRDDALFGWLWDPFQDRVADTNNASDGDILIAYALLKAAARWGEARYLTDAIPIIDAIAQLLLREAGGRIVVVPGHYGFDPGVHRDGPVVNLSYWVYGAFKLFAVVRPNHPWAALAQNGLALTDRTIRKRIGLPPDWLSLAEAPARPLSVARSRRSYDAVRIPLYMAMDRAVPSPQLTPFDEAWNLAAGGTPLTDAGQREASPRPMLDPGYRMVAALVACARRGVAIPQPLRRFRPTTYYASALHLLALSATRADYPACLR